MTHQTLLSERDDLIGQNFTVGTTVMNADSINSARVNVKHKSTILVYRCHACIGTISKTEACYN